MKLLPDYIRSPKDFRRIGDFFGKVEERIDELDYKVRVYYADYDLVFDSLDKIPENKFLFDKKYYINITLRTSLYDFKNKKQVIAMIFEDPIGVK